MSPHGTDGPSPIQRAAAGIGYSTIALHHHPASACDISIRNVRTHYFLDKREDGVTAAPAKPLTKARSMALSRSEPPRSLSISATRRSNALAALMRPSSSRHVSSCRGLPCASGDELVSLGFRVGNPSAIGWHQRRIFQQSCYPYALPRQRAENRDAQFAPKNGQKPSRAGAGVHETCVLRVDERHAAGKRRAG